jgi:RNA polymerase sigma factor (sigma-70 family)
MRSQIQNLRDTRVGMERVETQRIRHAANTAVITGVENMNGLTAEEALEQSDEALQKAARRWCSSELPFEDALQEVRIKFWQAFPHWHKRHSLESFAYVVARNYLHEHWTRKASRLPETLPILSKSEALRGCYGIYAGALGDTTDLISLLMGQMWAEGFVCSLSNPRHVQLVTLYMQGQTYTQIAEAMGYANGGKSAACKLLKRVVQSEAGEL